MSNNVLRINFFVYDVMFCWYFVDVVFCRCFCCCFHIRLAGLVVLLGGVVLLCFWGCVLFILVSLLVVGMTGLAVVWVVFQLKDVLRNVDALRFFVVVDLCWLDGPL